MRLPSLALLSVLVLLGCTTPAPPEQRPSQPEPMREVRLKNGGVVRLAPQRWTPQPLSLELVDATPQEAALRIARASGRPVLVDSLVGESVTILQEATPWRRTLDTVAQIMRCEVLDLPGGALYLVQPQVMTLQDGETTSARSVLQLVCTYSGQQVLIGPQVQGPGSSFIDADTLEAIRTIRGPEQPALHVSRLGPVLLITTRPRGIGRELRSSTELRRLPQVPSGPDAPFLELNLVRAPVQEVVRAIATLTGRDVRAPECDDLVSLEIPRASWRVVLAVLAHETGLKISQAEGGLTLRKGSSSYLRFGRLSLRTWLQLLARLAGVKLNMPAALDTLIAVPGELSEVDPRAALELLAAVHGLDTVESQGGLTLRPSAQPQVWKYEPHPAYQPPAPLPPAKLEARFDALLNTMHRIAQGGVVLSDTLYDLNVPETQPEYQYVPVLRALHELVEGQREAGVRAARKTLEAWRPKLAKHGGALKSVELQLLEGEGDALASAMWDAVRERRYSDLPRLAGSVQVLSKRLQAAGFEFKAKALLDRTRTLVDRARRLKIAAPVIEDLKVSAVALGERGSFAVVSGAVVELGDEVPGRPGLRLVRVETYRVVFDYRGTELAWELTLR